MAVTRARRGAARRDQLLDGLIEIFLAEGFAEFGLDDLAARLRCSKSTLYAVAPSKEQLITTVVRAFFRRSTARVEAAVRTEQDATARIRSYLLAISDELAPASAAFHADVEAFSPTRELYAQNTTAAASRVTRLVAEAAGPDRPVNADFLGAVAAEVMPAIQQGRIRGRTGLDDAAAYHALADLISAPSR